MGLECRYPEIKNFVIEKVLQAHGVNEQPEQCIAPAANRIAKGLQRHEFFKRRIEKIQNGDNLLFHEGAKVNKKAPHLRYGAPLMIALKSIPDGKPAPASAEGVAIVITKFKGRLPVKR